MIIEYNKLIQLENKNKIELFLAPFLWLIPNWVLFLDVNLWDCDESGKLAAVKLDYAYRRLTIDFYSSWLDRSDDEKRFVIVHELCHGFCGLIADFARDTINNLCPENEADKFNKHLQNELAIRHESATQDLAFAIVNNFK